MNTYLVTPVGVLGGDSFYLKAKDAEEAMVLARNTIAREDWSSPFGWNLFLALPSFEERTI